MKKTDIVQPIAMSSAFAEGVYSATSTNDFEIPAETSTSASDTCVQDDGFLPITSTDLDDGGIAPERKNFNGLFYLSTDQRFYLQNGGVITYDENVAAAIEGYPQGAILDYVVNNQFKKVQSLIDDNTYNFVDDPSFIDNEKWQELDLGAPSDYANQSLTNLTTLGNARLQYAPFAVNSGVVKDGNNHTLQTVGDTPTTITRQVVGVMSSNSENGVTVSISGQANQNLTVPYKVTNSSPELWYSYTGASGSAIFTFTLTDIIPQGAICNFQLTGNGGYTTQCSVSFNYSDSTSETMWSTSNVGSNTITQQVTASKDVSSITVYVIGNVAQSGYTVCRTYLGNFGLTATYSVSSSDTLICNPCTITTCDGRTKIFTTDELLDVSEKADGNYKIFKDFSTGALSLLSGLNVSKVRGKSWTQPILSANGTMGGSSFAVEANSEYSSTYAAWKAFDGIKNSNSNYWHASAADPVPGWLTFYNPEKLNVTNIALTNYTYSGLGVPTSGTIYGSDDNSTWTELKTWTNSNVTAGATWNIDLSSNTSFYKYHKIYMATDNDNDRLTLAEVEITATEYIDNWLDTSTIPANLYIGTTKNNDLVYIGDCTVSSGAISAISNQRFNDSSFLIAKAVTDAVMPDYNSGIDISAYNSSSNKFTAPLSGFIRGSLHVGYSTYGRQYIYIYDNKNTYLMELGNSTYSGSGYMAATDVMYPILKGYKVYQDASANIGSCTLTFYPLKGDN